MQLQAGCAHLFVSAIATSCADSTLVLGREQARACQCTTSRCCSAHRRHTSSPNSHSGGCFSLQYRQVRYRARRVSRAPLINVDTAFITAVSDNRRHFTSPTRQGRTTNEPAVSHMPANSETTTDVRVRCTTTSAGEPPVKM